MYQQEELMLTSTSFSGSQDDSDNRYGNRRRHDDDDDTVLETASVTSQDRGKCMILSISMKEGKVVGPNKQHTNISSSLHVS